MRFSAAVSTGSAATASTTAPMLHGKPCCGLADGVSARDASVMCCLSCGPRCLGAGVHRWCCCYGATSYEAPVLPGETKRAQVTRSAHGSAGSCPGARHQLARGWSAPDECRSQVRPSDALVALGLCGPSSGE